VALEQRNRARALYAEASQPLPARIAKLTSDLENASRSIALIERQVEARRQLVAKLEEDQRKYKQLADLNKPQVEAVAQALQQQIDQSNQRSFWQSFWINIGISVVFTILGAR
jgi:hypothetical protein